MLPFLLQLDDKLFCQINSHHSLFFDYFFSLITWLGNGWIITPILLFIAFLKIPKNKVLLFITICAIGMILSGLTNSCVKDQIQRPRPLLHFATNGPDAARNTKQCFIVHSVGPKLYQRSFPSGHSNTVFCAVMIVAFMFGNWFWIGFVPALLVAYSRVYLGVHFPLDTAGGAAIALLFMLPTVLIYKRISGGNRDPK